MVKQPTLKRLPCARPHRNRHVTSLSLSPIRADKPFTAAHADSLTQVTQPPEINMETETQRNIDTTVRRILEESDMDQVTESKIRKQASQELGLDLNKPPFKALVKQVVESFLEQQQHKQENDDDQQGREYDDNGDLVICRLSQKRKVTVQEFKGKPLVSLREFFTKQGKELPTSKGISLTEEQWSVFKKNVPAIEKAIQQMESRIN